MKNKVTVITGAAQGIGREIALYFAKAGSDICIGDVNYDLAKKVGKEIEDLGVKVLVVDIDVSDYLQIEQLINKTVKTFGKIDILINNAAYTIKIPFLDYTESDWKRIIDVSLNGYFFTSQLAAREMVKNGNENSNGKIINISSVVGFIPHGGLMAYSVAKAGIASMTKLMSHELRNNNISVNAVAPAITDTPLMKGVIGKIGGSSGPMIPKSAITSSEDVAKVVYKVAVDEENLINGNIINVGGSVIAS